VHIKGRRTAALDVGLKLAQGWIIVIDVKLEIVKGR